MTPESADDKLRPLRRRAWGEEMKDRAARAMRAYDGGTWQ